MRKALIALGVLAVSAVLFVQFLPSLLLRYPTLLGIVARALDPIGPHREVTWEAGSDLAAIAPGDRPPNVILILVDDLGFNDLSWNGGGIAGGTVPTTHIDSIAHDGVEFTNGYAGNATCAPSRAAILTGRYPTRFGFEFTPAPAAMPKMMAELQNDTASARTPATVFLEENVSEVPALDDMGVPSSEITIAELLRDNGYRTLMLGKWHLGESEGMRPWEQGFDEFLGFLSGGQMYLDPDDPDVVNAKQDFDPIDQFLWPILPFAVRKNGGPRFTPDEYMTDYLSREAVKAIEANRNRPFFLYLAYNAPHTPLQATREDYDALSHIEHHPTRVYAAMIRAIDRGVGEVLQALRDNGLDENTLVLFSSDNGGAHYIGLPQINAPYRGWKMTFFEGGVHSPFFLKWPASLPAGRSTATPAAHIDLFRTIADAASLPIPADRVIDGTSLLPIARLDTAETTRDPLFWRSGETATVRDGRWKLLVDRHQGKKWLFDLETDPTERANLATTHAAEVARLEALLAAHEAQMVAPGWPSLIIAPIAADHSLNQPWQPGDEYTYWWN